MTSPIRARLPRLVALAALAILPWLGGSAIAQAWPAKPVRIVFPYSAGGPVDVLLRALAMRMSETMGQQFVVENRPGANEIISAEAVARAAPDGYTLLFASDAVFSLNPHLYSKLPYDANKDFAPIARVINAYLMLVGRTDLPPKDLKELFAYIKANNGKISYGSVGLGSVNHLSMSWLANQQGLEMIHVPFKGVGPMVQEIAANRLDLAFAVVGGALPFLKANQVKAYAVSAPTRMAVIPNVPTFTELGFPALNASFYFALAAPAGTSPEIVSRVAAEAGKIVTQTEFREKYVDTLGFVPVAETPAQFAEFLKRDRESAAQRVKVSGAKLD
jgi:tripartite-type tricarboxylate transporter receptor subunit TctC